MIGLILFFTLSIGFSFLCSILEAVLLSITPRYVRSKVAEGKAEGRLLEKFKEDIDRPLSAILTLNTIAHTVGAIGVGVTAGKIFGENYLEFGPISISYESIIASVMTLAILILSEIIPKTIGANNWRGLASFTVRSISILLFLLKPFVWLSQLITKTLKKDKEMSVLTRSDLVALAEEAEDSGTIEQSESQVINNVFKFKDLRARNIMTPRSVVLMADGDTKIQDFFNEHKPIRFSRIPIFEEKMDNIIGVVLKDEILQSIIEGNGDLQLKDLQRQALFVEDQMTLRGLFDVLSRRKSHLAVVRDEFGGLDGIVTLEDLFETLLGQEIMDEYDKVEDLQAYAKTLYKKTEENSSENNQSESY